MPSQIGHQLLKSLTYNPETGEFLWKISNGPAKAGSPAGSLSNGYIRISVNGNRYRAHRIAWFMHYGKWPAWNKEIDHINGVRHDNRISNLREVTRSENMLNAYARNPIVSTYTQMKIRAALSEGLSLREIASYLGIGHATVHRIKRGSDAKFSGPPIEHDNETSPTGR